MAQASPFPRLQKSCRVLELPWQCPGTHLFAVHSPGDTGEELPAGAAGWVQKPNALDLDGEPMGTFLPLRERQQETFVTGTERFLAPTGFQDSSLLWLFQHL